LKQEMSQLREQPEECSVGSRSWSSSSKENTASLPSFEQVEKENQALSEEVDLLKEQLQLGEKLASDMKAQIAYLKSEHNRETAIVLNGEKNDQEDSSASAGKQTVEFEVALAKQVLAREVKKSEELEIALLDMNSFMEQELQKEKGRSMELTSTLDESKKMTDLFRSDLDRTNEKMNRLALSNKSEIDGLKSELEKSSRKHLDKEKEVELLKMGLKERQVRFNEEIARLKTTISKRHKHERRIKRLMLENERLQQQLSVGERIKKLMLENERIQQHLDDGIVVVKDIPSSALHEI